MTKKHWAPYDLPNSPPLTILNAPKPPHFLDPVPESQRRTRSLYLELFGSGIDPVVDSFQAPWMTDEQRELATRIMSGQDPRSLDKDSLVQLDDIARRYMEEYDASLRARSRQRLSILERRGEVGEEGGPEEMPPGGGFGLPSDGAPEPTDQSVLGAYGWLGQNG